MKKSNITYKELIYNIKEIHIINEIMDNIKVYYIYYIYYNKLSSSKEFYENKLWNDNMIVKYLEYKGFCTFKFYKFKNINLINKLILYDNECSWRMISKYQILTEEYIKKNLTKLYFPYIFKNPNIYISFELKKILNNFDLSKNIHYL